MREAEVYLMQFKGMSAALTTQIDELSEELIAKRPGPSLNPVRWNYFHLLRVWDADLNWFAKQQSPEEDAWHRGGFSERSGYEPIGKGMRGMGIGTGYSDAEVDALNVPPDVLKAYQQQLMSETEEFLRDTDDASLARETQPLPNQPPPVTVGMRLQHAIGHGWNHIGELRYAKGMLGLHDPSYPGAGNGS